MRRKLDTQNVWTLGQVWWVWPRRDYTYLTMKYLKKVEYLSLNTIETWHYSMAEAVSHNTRKEIGGHPKNWWGITKKTTRNGRSWIIIYQIVITLHNNYSSHNEFSVSVWRLQNDNEEKVQVILNKGFQVVK